MSHQTFRWPCRVQFRDTDAAGIMHFSTFFTYMEQAEHAFLRSLGHSVMPARQGNESDDDHISWPRVSTGCDFRKPLKFEDEFEVELSIRRLGSKSVTYSFHFLQDKELIAEGTITAVSCRMQHGSPPQPVPIPESFRQQLEPFVDASAIR